MQQFDNFTLATDVQPQSSLPPPEWKYGRGRQAVEMIRPDAAMTLFVKVSNSSPYLGLQFVHAENDLEWSLDEAWKDCCALSSKCLLTWRTMDGANIYPTYYSSLAYHMYN